MTNGDDPYFDDILPFEIEPLLSVDQAILRMLGYTGPFVYGEGEYADSYTLEDHIPKVQMDAKDQLHEARAHEKIIKKQSGTPANELKEAANDVKNKEIMFSESKKTINTANQYRAQIKNEITKIRAGKRSLLAIYEDESQRQSNILISASSFEHWLSELDHNNLSEHKTNGELSEEFFEKGLSRAVGEATYVTLGILIQLLANKVPEEYMKGNAPNISKISKAAEELARKLNDNHDLAGQKGRVITKRLNLGEFMLKESICPVAW